MGGVTLEAVMAQPQCMDACLDTLNDELCQVNTHVGRIAWQQACLSGFVESSSPSPEAPKDGDDNGGFDGDDDDEDKELFQWRGDDCLSDLPFVIHDKKGK